MGGMNVFSRFGGNGLYLWTCGMGSVVCGTQQTKITSSGSWSGGTALAPIAEAFIRGWAVASANLILDGLHVVQFALPLYLF